MIYFQDHSTLSVERNYLVSLAISNREAFLTETGKAFSASSGNVIHAINTDSLNRQRRYGRYTVILISLFFLSTLGALFVFIRYSRLVSRSLSRAITSIRNEHYEYSIPYLPRDEFGDLMVFMKEMSMTLGESLYKSRNSEPFLQEIIDSIAEPIMPIDLDYQVRLLNRTAREKAGTDPGSNGNLRCYEVSHGTDEPCGGVDHLCPLEQCGGTVEFNVPAITIESDGDMLWHLFSNLMNNAIKFRKQGEPVHISVSAEAADGRVTVRFKDDGVGLSQADREMVFERFYQSTASSEGSGVGLTICKMIAEDLGGTVEIESEGKDLGALAVATLPSAGPTLTA